jgi:integrase
MNLHSLRHIAVSRTIVAGVDVAVVARRFGHSSSAVTLTLYTHASEEPGACGLANR